jgi:hypothetical protein
MKAYGEWMYRSTFFLTSALVGGEWSASRPGRFIPGERAFGTHWIRGWVDLRAGLDDLEKRKFLTNFWTPIRVFLGSNPRCSTDYPDGRSI